VQIEEAMAEHDDLVERGAKVDAEILAMRELGQQARAAYNTSEIENKRLLAELHHLKELGPS
jgi:hypothetical protein